MKIDLHCHSYYSYDGVCPPRKMLKTALKKGLDGIAITDHDTDKGWDEAIKAAKELNIFVILGEEIKTREGDILGLFLKQETKGKGEDSIKVIKKIKAQGGIAVIPHPFHFCESFKADLRKYVDLIDGIEVFNARLPFSFADKKALEFAKKYNIAMTGGSDAHYHSGIGDAYTFAKANNLEEFKAAILRKETKAEGKKSPLRYFIFPALAKTGLVGVPPKKQ